MPLWFECLTNLCPKNLWFECLTNPSPNSTSPEGVIQSTLNAKSSKMNPLKHPAPNPILPLHFFFHIFAHRERRKEQKSTNSSNDKNKNKGIDMKERSHDLPIHWKTIYEFLFFYF